MLRASSAVSASFIVATLLCGCTRAPVQTKALNDSILASLAPDGVAYADNIWRDLERVRAATTDFQDIAAAQKAGYPTTTPACLKSATGGMGQHYVMRTLLDDQLDVEKPEILLYAPQPDGKLKLVAVEYIIPLSAWQQEQPPRIFGQSLKRSEELKLWYLHVWAWERNTQGLFADWNPAVKC